MAATDMDARRSRFVMLAVGVLIASQQVIAPARLWADQEQQIDALIAQLEGPDRAAASRARLTLSKMGAPAVKKLVPLLRHEKREVRRDSCSTILLMAGRDSVPRGAMNDAIVPLVAAMGDEDSSVAHLASTALSTIGPSAIKHLIPALRDEKMSVRIGAARAVANIGEKPGTPPSATAGAIAPLTAMTKDSDIQARANAYRALATVDARRRVEILLKAFDDPDPRLSLFAAGFIATHAARGPWAKQLRDKRLVDRLTTATKAADSGLSSTATRALQWLRDPKAAAAEVEAAMRRKHEAPSAGTSGADRQAAEMLRQPVARMDFTRTPVKDAIQFIRERSGMNILTDWRALEKFGIASATAVTVTARDVSVSEALRLILADVAKGSKTVRFEAIGGVVVISTPADLLAIQKTRQVEQARRRVAGAADQAVWKKLDGPMPKIDFKDIPLNDALTFWREVLSVPLMVDWKALEDLGVQKTSRITVHLRNATAATTLWAMLLNTGNTRELAIGVKNGAVTISKAGAIPLRPPAGTARPTPPPRKPSPPKAPPSDDTAAARMLRLAELYRSNKNTDKAVGLYREIVKRYPGTKAAGAARKYLAEMDGR